MPMIDHGIQVMAAKVLGITIGTLGFTCIFNLICVRLFRSFLPLPHRLWAAYGASWLICVALYSFGSDQYPDYSAVVYLVLAQIAWITFDFRRSRSADGPLSKS